MCRGRISGIIIFSDRTADCRFIYRIYLQEEAAIRASCKHAASSDNASFVERSTVHVARGDALKAFWLLSTAMALRHMVTEGVSFTL
jgi:hypothetical protein